MAATVRKQQKGASPSTNNRRSAWRGGPPHFTNQGHASRSHGPPIPTPGQGFPPMNQVNAPSLSLQQSLGLALNTNIVVFIRNGSRHAGTLVSIESTGFTLKHSKELSRPNSAPQDSMFFPAEQLVNWHPGESPSGHAKGFRTDSDISQNARSPRERPLQAWTADPNHVPPLQPPMPNGSALQNPDDATFGPNANTGQPWDQFVANQQLFGVTATFNEEMYTTPLDRNAPDFKEREARAIKIANEIQSSASNNPHIAEERNLLDDSGANEEDKYGAVVRAPGAYVPPGARAAAAAQPSPSIRTSSDRSAAPTVTSSNATNASVHGIANATPVTDARLSANISDSKPPGSVGNESGDNKLVGAFRDFVDSERQRFVQKKQQIVKKEKDNRIADLLKFSQEFKLNRPIPPDLLPILSKDEKKQHEIAERSKSEASSTSARAIGATAAHSGVDHSPQVPPRPIAALPPQGKADASLVKRPLATSGATPVPPRLPVTPANPKPIVPSTVTPSGPATSTSRGSTMVIQKIPPYRKKPDQSPPGTTASPANLSDSGAPASPTNSNASGSNAFKFNAKASSFRPNPNASAFKPVVTSPTPAASTSNAKSVKVEQTVPPNPFFGARPVNKKPIHIKEDFNPFKFAQVAEAPVTTPQWPYSGKRYMAMFPTIHSPNHAPSVPGPPFEEDPAAAAARGYGMMYYAPYPYQGQHPQQQMMTVPGTAAPPPGYMPSPFMQPLPYPPPPHQPNGPPAMYGPPPLNGMQAHGYPPPPGPYPPNGAPRGSMPPTPIQQPAYAYHQSPQMSHAVPYPMMMSQPPPPGGAAPPLPYDQSGPPGGPGSGPPPMNMGH